tara:strand:- start:1683 stop:2177 length:495 start_codon:yes stop_codon:yes gene_type:complete
LTPLEKIAAKHNDWLYTVKSFGCKPEIAEDIVQECYLKLDKLLKSGLDISYGDEINYYYVYKTLKALYLDLCRKEKKIFKVGVEALEKYINEEVVTPPKDITSKMKQLDTLLDEVYWYDKKVFEIISSGTSIMELSRKTNISYYSLYNTYSNVKKLIKKNIEWD